MPPDTSGVAALVPVKSLAQHPWRVVVLCVEVRYRHAHCEDYCTHLHTVYWGKWELTSCSLDLEL